MPIIRMPSTVRTDPTARRRRPALIVAALLCVGLFAACTSKDSPATGSASTSAQANASTNAQPAPKYDPKIHPADFTHRITNPYFPLEPGSVYIVKGRKDGVPQIHKTTVLRRARKIMGVRCVFVKDVVTSNGEIAERTSDWYAQDSNGAVWYFGEATADYKNGVVTSTQGSWEAGVDGAKPGIIMQAKPRPGPAYYEEFRPGIAEDKGKVLRTGDTVKTPAGTFKNVVVIRDTNPLDPTLVQHKYYARGVGLVLAIRTGSSHRERSHLVRIVKG